VIKITDLIINGEDLKKHSRRLQRKYHLKKADIEDFWDWVAKSYKGISQEEIRLLRDTTLFMKEKTAPRRIPRTKTKAKEITKEEYKK
jgi:hypothetical protein